MIWETLPSLFGEDERQSDFTAAQGIVVGIRVQSRIENVGIVAAVKYIVG